MRILILNWRDLKHPRAGGAERYVDEIARCWHAEGHKVTLFCSSFEGASREDQQGAVSVIRRGNRHSVYWHARELLRSREWDVVVESVNTRPWFVHERAHAPTVAIFYQLARDVWFFEAPPPIAIVGRYLLEPLWLRRYRGAPVVSLSDSTRSDLLNVGVTSLAIVPPGRPQSPQIAFSKEGVPTFMYMGRLQKSKRPHHALAAFRMIQRHSPEAQLWMVGNGPLRIELERAATKGVTVFGSVEEHEKWELLQKAHLLLVPSVREGWGLVVSEAAAVGTAAVGYRIPGLTDSIIDGETGWLCSPSPAAMAKTVEAVLPLAELIGKRAMESAPTGSWADSASAILNAALSGRSE